MDLKKIKRVYLSGAISNDKDARGHFKLAQDKVKAIFPNADIINPFDISDQLNIDYEKAGRDPPSYDDYLDADILELINCDAIYMLKGWNASKGAKIERAQAMSQDILILYEK